MEPTRTCAACATEIPERAEKCPRCRSRQPGAPPMHRGVPGRLVGGVCAMLARELGVDPLLVRIGFVLLAVLSLGVAFWGYVLLWLATPPSETEHAPAKRALDWLGGLFSSPQAPGSNEV